MFMRTMVGVLLVLGVLVSSAAAQSWKAGAAKVNITPDEYIWMAGYAARDKPAQGKMTELWAKALVFGTGNTQLVLITLDLVGIDRELSVSICDKLQKKHRLERRHIVLNCSHTHSGPVVSRNLRPMHEYSLDKTQQALIHKYADRLEAAVIDVVDQAMNKLAPATVSWGKGRTDFA